MEQKEPVRVLHVLTGLTTGGAESFIMNMYRNLDRNQVQFDFLLRSSDNIYKDELEEMGSRIYVTAAFPRHFIQNAIQTSAFFKTHHYDIIHVHANALLYTYALECAKKSGVKCRIIHSHNAAMAHMQLLPIHRANKRRIGGLATEFFACSNVAGQWMFDRDFSVIPNAIDLPAFTFNVETRDRIREKYGIRSEELVIGHIGRFTEQKNHSFLLDVFAEIIKIRPNSKLMLVGDGELRCSIEAKAEKQKLRNKIVFLGSTNTVSEIVNAFDVFVFPSVYEGLGIVALEAQANGLRMICSEAVPSEVLMDDSMCTLPLSAGAEYWAWQILNMDTKRLDLTERIRSAGYDVRYEAQKLQAFYISRGQ